MVETARDRIERFLADHPNGRLTVAVGYASPAGVAWLDKMTQGRPVQLLIGNTQSRYWRNRSAADGERAASFVRRPDSEIKNWYRTDKSPHGAAELHVKAWLVGEGTIHAAALNGSANLSNNGLDVNVELLTEVVGRDLQEVSESIQHYWDKAWDCKKQLMGYLVPKNAADSKQSRRAASNRGDRGSGGTEVSNRRPEPQPSDGVHIADVVEVLGGLLQGLARRLRK